MVDRSSELESLTTNCIHCGLCLEACPTFVLTGDESRSPRGRIHLIKAALEGHLDWEKHLHGSLDTCLGCLSCQTACPSGVRYGSIIELARDQMNQLHRDRPKAALLKTVTSPTAMKVASALPIKRMPTPLSELLWGQAPEADTPRPQPHSNWPNLNEQQLIAPKGEVFFLDGCAMRVLFPRVHEASRRLLRRVGYTVRETQQGCCGAMHAHAGELDKAIAMADDLAKTFQPDLPIVVDSAGCGSWLKERLGERVYDLSEFLLSQGLVSHIQSLPARGHRIGTYHDACHLAHGQGIRSQPRQLLSAIPGYEWVDLPESEMCCGSAGTYNVTQPRIARQLLDRKWHNIETTGAQVVVLGNPGCHAWIAQAAREAGDKVQVLHLAELLESLFSGLP